MTKLVPRPTRVLMRPLHAVWFRPTGAERPVEVHSISVTGLGLMRAGRRDWPAPGSPMTGELSWSGESFPIALKVAHLGEEIVGCAFQGADAQLARAIERRFDVEHAAAQTTKIDPRMLKQPDEGAAAWFQGVHNCELYFETDRSGAVTGFHLSVFGNYLEGDEGGQLIFGREVQDPIREKPGYKAAPIVAPSGESPAGREAQLTGALRFVRALPGLAPQQRDQLLGLMTRRHAAR